MRDGKIVLQAKIIVSNKELDEVRTKFMKQLDEGVAVVPCGFEVFYIPPDEMRVDNEPI